MKIILLQDHLRSGGTERQTVLLANAFARAGDDVALVTFRPGGALEPTIAPGVRRHALQPFDLGLDWFAPRLVAKVRAELPDIVLCMGRMANCHAGRLQRRLAAAGLPTRVVATLRTGKALPALFRRSLLAVAHVVANSEETGRVAMTRHGVTPGRISVIHNALIFPDDRTPEEALGLREAHGAGPRTTVLLNVAMFRPEKNQRELIEIAAGLPVGFDWQLWLVGDGRTRAACEWLAAKHGLRTRIRFTGWQSDPSALYAAADIAVHASWSESLSNFVIEAQAHGLPAVVYEAMGISECFVPGDTGFVIPRGDRDAFRAIVARLGDSQPAEAQLRSGRARRHARTTFDPGRQVAAYRKLFRSLAEG